ncbi:hypothetical protein C0Q70_21197 [Pomacea canaliculata]|uniref:Uncharacterized protein n=1 Tax=Pomacea canaliculata TaxID=400727 RepID=A0A2T7NBV8_POMCA|nr:hypothetical protein C0Q70_21197 [Pomacea canaliculata]
MRGRETGEPGPPRSSKDSDLEVPTERSKVLWYLLVTLHCPPACAPSNRVNRPYRILHLQQPPTSGQATGSEFTAQSYTHSLPGTPSSESSQSTQCPDVAIQSYHAVASPQCPDVAIQSYHAVASPQCPDVAIQSYHAVASP